MDIDPPSATIYHFPVANLTKHSSPTEEAGAVPIAPSGEPQDEIKGSGRTFLRAARRDLTQEEAASPAGVRWLQHDVERLDQDCLALRKEIQDLREKHETLSTEYHDKRIEVEALKAVARASIRNEILANMCLAAGSAGLSVMPGYLSIPAATQLAEVGLVVSGLLFFAGIALRMWK
jgi:hypothetical protein